MPRVKRGHDHRVIYFSGQLADDVAMGKLEDRQRYIRHIIDERFGGVLSKFAVAIGKDASYVSRMLYSRGRRNAKGIGADMWEIITEKFGDPKPMGAATAPGYLDHLTDVHVALHAIVKAMALTIPPSGDVFLSRIQAVSDELGIQADRGLLGSLVATVRPTPKPSAAGARDEPPKKKHGYDKP